MLGSQRLLCLRVVSTLVVLNNYILFLDSHPCVPLHKCIVHTESTVGVKSSCPYVIYVFSEELRHLQ